MKIGGSLARNIVFEMQILRFVRKTHRKTSILKLQSVKIGGGLARNAHFEAPCMSRRESLVFLWPRRVYGGKLQNYPF